MVDKSAKKTTCLLGMDGRQNGLLNSTTVLRMADKSVQLIEQSAYNLWFLHVQRLWSQAGDVLHIVIWV